MNKINVNQSVPDRQAGVRSVKKQNDPCEKTANTTRNAGLAVIGVALVLLVAFLAASGTKVLDITALQGKGGTTKSQQPAASAAQGL